MKKVIFVLLSLVLFQLGAVGQYEYTTKFLPEAGLVWQYQMNDSGNPERNTDLYITLPERGECDTIVSYHSPLTGEIETRQCKKLIVRTYSTSGEDTFRRAAYEEDGKIYLHSPETMEFSVVMDFSLQEGDHTTIDNAEYEVSRVDFVYQYEPLKRVKLAAEESNISWVWRVGMDKFDIPSGNRLPEGTYMLERVIPWVLPTSDYELYNSEIFTMPTFNPGNSYYAIDKFWLYSNTAPDDPENPYYYGKLVTGDCEACHVPCRSLAPTNADGDITGDTFEYVCEYDGETYVYEPTSGQFCSLLNFNYDVGKKVSDDRYADIRDIDEIEVDGITRKRFIFTGWDKDSDWKYWVEGIGESNGNVISPMITPSDNLVRTEKVFENGKCVFTYLDFADPGAGTNGVETVAVPENQHKESVIYDLGGSRIASPKNGEPFIRNGRVYLKHD